MFSAKFLQDIRNEDIQRYYDMRRASNLLGKQMLMARRLCEAGCGFVTVSDCGWDMHANSNSPKNMTNLDPMARQVDQPLAVPGHAPAQAEQAHAVLAEGVEPDAQRPAVRPEGLVSFVKDVVFLTIPLGISLEEES